MPGTAYNRKFIQKLWRSNVSRRLPEKHKRQTAAHECRTLKIHEISEQCRENRGQKLFWGSKKLWR